MSRVDEIKKKMKELQDELIKVDGSIAGGSKEDKDMTMKKAIVIKKLKSGKK